MSYNGVRLRVHFEVDGIRGAEVWTIFGRGKHLPQLGALWELEHKLTKLKVAREIESFSVLSAEILPTEET